MMTCEQAGDRLMVLLEGNIGAGKTTVGRAVTASGTFSFIEEPTRAWRQDLAVNMLELFYSDPHRWAFTFQICAFITRAKTWHQEYLLQLEKLHDEWLLDNPRAVVLDGERRWSAPEILAKIDGRAQNPQ